MDKNIATWTFLKIRDLCTSCVDGGILLFGRQGWFLYLLGQNLQGELQVSWYSRKSTGPVGCWSPGFRWHRHRYCLRDLWVWVSGPQFPYLLHSGVRGNDLCGFSRLWYPLGLRIAFSVCHSLPCQLCLSQRLIHFNCTLECSRERRLDGLFCTYYCIRTFAFFEEIVPCLKSVCLSAHWLCLCCSLATVPLLPASISLQDLDSASDCTCLVLCSICLLHS